MKSTQDCKAFLADFFKATPSLIPPIYEGAEGAAAQAWAIDEKNWKRLHKGKPHGDNSYIENDTTPIWTKGASYPRGPSYYHCPTIKSSDVAVERHFALKQDELDTGVIFMVLEDHAGKLYLGEYVGD